MFIYWAKHILFGHKGERAQDYYDITDKNVKYGRYNFHKMERSPHRNRIQDVVMWEKKESLREAIKVQDRKPFVLHINQFVLHYDTMYV